MLPVLGAAAWCAIAFLCGSLPFSLWVGRWALGVDIRRYGDSNPGAANVWRASRGRGRGWAGIALVALALSLDFLKGAVPVSVARSAGGIDGVWLAVLAVAPVAGHAFSPLLGFRGGKALTVTFGVWSALTLWQVPLVLGGLFALWLAVLGPEAWAVLMSMLCMGLFVLMADASSNPAHLLAWAGNTLIVVWKHRHQLGQPPQLCRWLVGPAKSVLSQLQNHRQGHEHGQGSRR